MPTKKQNSQHSQTHAGAFEAARQIAMERKALLNRLRNALLVDDQKLAITLAKQLCGIEDGEPACKKKRPR